MRPEAFLALVRTLTAGPGSERVVPAPARGEEVAYLTLAGAVDLLAERLPADRSGEEALRAALRTSLGVEGALRFELHEHAERVEALERAARMRRRDIAMTEGWLVPRLEREIERFEARVAALERALGGKG